MTSDARIARVGDLYVVRFERRLNHPVERVWAALTEPEQLKQWLAATEIDPVPGGRYALHFQNIEHTHIGRVIRYEPPHLFEHTFGDDSNGVVRWELESAGEGCLLRLSHSVYASQELANFAAGWHTHLELLEALLRGSPAPWNWDRWYAHRDSYVDQVQRCIHIGATNS